MPQIGAKLISTTLETMTDTQHDARAQPKSDAFALLGFLVGCGRQGILTRVYGHAATHPQTPSNSISSARATQRGYDARRHDAGQVGLQIQDKLPTVHAIKIELSHRMGASEAPEPCERQPLSGNLIRIGIDRGVVLCAP